jgi:MoaA/NifB/PqqE/SkfB family radical SAM enzyme
MGGVAHDLVKLSRRFVEPIAYAMDASFVKPTNISLSLTNRCNLKCPTCSYWHTPIDAKADELSLDEMKKLVAQLREWLGPFLLGFTGGEPFLRPEAYDLARECARLGVRVATVTNGSLFTGDRLKQLKEVLNAPDSTFDIISLSLNHLDAEKHNVTRGVDTSAQRIFDALKELNVPGRRYKLQISTILMGHNLEHAAEMVKWVADQGLDAITFQSFYFESGNSDYVEGWYKESEFWDGDAAKVDRALDALIDLKRRRFPITNSVEQMEWMRHYLKDPEKPIDLPCKVGVAHLGIEPNGDLRLCDIMDPVGNVRQHHPQEIWESTMAAARRKDIRLCEAQCRIKTCNFRKPLISIARERILGY